MHALRPMYLGDLRKVLQIIDDHDEDDAEAAKIEYEDEGFDHQFVLEIDEQVVGVTGFRTIEATDKSCWLSWTYLAKEYQGKGHGRTMLTLLLEKLSDINCRKIFVKVSDYNDPEDGKIYEKALQLYQSIGFVKELVNKDFYDDGENQIILGMEMDKDSQKKLEEHEKIREEKPIIRFNGIYEIAETDDAYSFRWEVLKAKKIFSKRNFTAEDLMIGINAAKAKEGRKVFITFPSNLPLIHIPLQSTGFKLCGKLSHYYEEGVHDLHFTYDLG